MLFWLVCSLLLFILVELFDWFHTLSISLSLPISILGGVFLAITSNYRQIADSHLHKPILAMLIPSNQKKLPPESIT
jgi:uncharacterized membrane protein